MRILISTLFFYVIVTKAELVFSQNKKPSPISLRVLLVHNADSKSEGSLVKPVLIKINQGLFSQMTSSDGSCFWNDISNHIQPEDTIQIEVAGNTVISPQNGYYHVSHDRAQKITIFIESCDSPNEIERIVDYYRNWANQGLDEQGKSKSLDDFYLYLISKAQGENRNPVISTACLELWAKELRNSASLKKAKAAYVRGQYLVAASDFRKAAEQTRNPVEKANALRDQGRSFYQHALSSNDRSIARYELADSCFNLALKEVNKLALLELKAGLKNDIGRTRYMRGRKEKNEKALEFYEEARIAFQEASAIDTMAVYRQNHEAIQDKINETKSKKQKTAGEITDAKDKMPRAPATRNAKTHPASKIENVIVQNDSIILSGDGKLSYSTIDYPEDYKARVILPNICIGPTQTHAINTTSIRQARLGEHCNGNKSTWAVFDLLLPIRIKAWSEKNKIIIVEDK